MKKTTTVKQLQNHIASVNKSPSGFVPTMGALHEGHLSLVKLAKKTCAIITVSIFVNPNQFNDKEDLKNYPRNIEKDLTLLKRVMGKDDVVFIPEVSEIYPEEDTRRFDFGNLDKVMEGEHRPGHFNGVAQVVSRLFSIVMPDIAYFGQKDFQQLTIIKELVRQTGSTVKITSCPIVREKDGLAMSSRNQLLEPEIRKRAPVIFRTLSEAAAMGKTSEIDDIKNYVIEKINRTEGFTIEYFEIADDVELKPVQNRAGLKQGMRYYGCIAAKAGKIRLIDNIEISLF